MGNESVNGRPIRVAHVMWGLMVGGLENLVMQIADRSRAHGIEPMLMAFGRDGPMRDVAARLKIPVEYLGDLPGLSVPLIRKMGQTLEDFGADLAHAHDIGPWLNVSAARAVRPKTQVMATFHQLHPPKGARRALATTAAFFTRAMVACGNEVEVDLRRWAPPGSRIVTIGNGVPIPPPPTAEKRARARRRLQLGDDAIVIGYLGRLFEEKGPDLLVESFTSRFASRPNVHLVVVGYGPMERELRAKTAHLPNVHFLGQVTDDAVGLMQGFDIYAQASRREGRSLAMLEAMAAALPTVAHDLPAIAEIHTKQSAKLVPLGDTVAFGAALEQLADDAAFRRSMGEAARVEVRRFAIDTMIESYVSLYRSVAGATGPARRAA